MAMKPVVGRLEEEYLGRVEFRALNIDDAETMHELLDLGVDGIMTDQPETLKHVMIERGVW